MVLFAVLLIVVVALAGAAAVVLARRRRPLDAEAADRALAAAAARLAAGQAAQARRRYAQLAGRLADAPEELRPRRGLALLGQAEATIPTGDQQATLALHREAFPLLADPARQLPRWGLRRLAEERTAQGPAASGGDLAPVLAFLQAAATAATAAEPGESGEEAAAAARVQAWLQQLCRDGSAEQRDRATAGALAALPGRDWPVLARAALLRATDRAAEAERLLAATAPGGSGELSFRWGAQLYTLHRDEAAVAAFDEALRRGPGEPSPWGRGPALRTDSLLFRGLARQRLGDTDAAWADLVAAVGESPTDPRPRYALGRLALLLGADEQAREQFAAALTVQPDFAPARFGLALVHERAGSPERAAADYRAGLDRAPDWRPAKVRLGAALLAAGQAAEAEPLLRTEAATDPAGRWARIAGYHHGLALARQGDPAGALARWEQLDDPELRDRRALARDRLARTRLATDPAAARELWQQAAAEHPEAPGYRAALREAALREAAHLLVTGRDHAESRGQAAAALALADSLPGAHTHRQARLRAALALAEGQAQPVLTLLDAAAGPRDRYHLAAAALSTGSPVLAVKLLGAADTAPSDPAAARLRAVLAERAGNWAGALEWYRDFLAGDSRSEAPADAPGQRPATAACGGCGREEAADDLYAPAGGASPRCVRCAAPALRAVLDCARRAGTPEQAEPVLAAWTAAFGDSPAAVPVRLDLALLRAELGRLDEALADLTAPPGRGRSAPSGAAQSDAAQSDAARADAARAAVLVRRAGAALAEGRPGAAVGDLREALSLAPAHPRAADVLGLLAEHEAHQHAVEGRHREAFDAYRALLVADPAHPRLLHALGLAGYRLAVAEGERGTDEVWSWTLGCLVAALHQEGLWTESVRSTGRPLDPQRLAAARTALTDRLREDLRALDRAAGRSGDEARAWTLRLGLEAHSAEAFAAEDVRIAPPGRPARRLALGPTLDGLLRRQPELADWGAWFDRAVDAWRRPAADAEPSALTRALDLFGDLGPQRYLLLQGRQAAAVAALDAVPENRRDTAWRMLLGACLIDQARSHHRNQDWREVLECLTRARAVPGLGLPADVPRIAAESGVRAARALLKRGVDDQAGAADLLEQARMLAPDDPEVRADLGATYAQWARKVNNEDRDYVRALFLVRKSLRLAPGDPTAKDILAAALSNRANKLARPDAPVAELEEAAEHWRELVGFHPDPEHRLGLGFALRMLARAAAFDGDRGRAIGLMTEALGYDPEWSGDPAREAPRRISVMLANHMLDNMKDSSFVLQAAMLQKAMSFDDSSDLRRLMVNVWRGEAAGHFKARRYDEAIRLLEEAAGLADNPEQVDTVRGELGVVYSAYAVQRANARQLVEARRLIRKAVENSPGDYELRALQSRIEAIR
ncbi:tetratricopeptide repeat protein [Streptomyces rubellomurinus]|uniref:Tetratricopeptide repeat protein n=1 Tax=Streptomyces rubellomurinus (strain ATCC 31215) TaxID=359131 RepID=A0A0F2TL32_STRR3|nr:tetratricopeptide repeat protein [Streptomyces rubellomurinus]KJS62975.1 hypothetical protein VM95_05680 [Streptomyces rubellomurinus]